MSIQKSLKNAMLTGNGLISWQNNTPTQFSQRQEQYFSPETRTFTQRMARYSSDFVEAQVQGLDPTDPFSWQTRMIRMADLVRPTAAIQRDFDDYKTILFADRDIEYIMPGAKIVTMGSTWLAVNPLNISGSDGASVVRRCNAVWNFLDYYGNVVSEPLLVENTRANANGSDTQQSLNIAQGYFNVICQYNDNTRQIDTNTRMILGTAAYRVTGYSDFDQEFTGDYSSVRTLSYTIRFEEVNESIDDMVNHVAGGKTFSWAINASGPSSLSVGATAQLAAQSVRNGKIVVSTPANPIWYVWESSDESVLTVDETGLVTAVGEGSATVRVKLDQNTEWHTNYAIEVTVTADGVKFTSSMPESMSAYTTATLTAAYFLDGDEQSNALAWAFFGADATAFSAEIQPDGKSVSVSCFGYSTTPLVVTASYGTYTASASIALQGI